MSQCYSIIIDLDLSAPDRGKEVVDGLNAIDKHYIYKLMSNVQLPGSKTFYSQIIMPSCSQTNDVSLAKTSQTYLSKDHRKHGVIDQVNYRKRSSKIKCTDR